MTSCSNKNLPEEWEDVEEEEDEMEEEEEETMDQEEGDPAAQSDPQPAALPGCIPVTDCLFCSHHSQSLMKNVAHMTGVHSFFIPDVEFLVDLKGLIRYLGEFGVVNAPCGTIFSLLCIAIIIIIIYNMLYSILNYLLLLFEDNHLH